MMVKVLLYGYCGGIVLKRGCPTAPRGHRVSSAAGQQHSRLRHHLGSSGIAPATPSGPTEIAPEQKTRGHLIAALFKAGVDRRVPVSVRLLRRRVFPLWRRLYRGIRPRGGEWSKHGRRVGAVVSIVSPAGPRISRRRNVEGLVEIREGDSLPIYIGFEVTASRVAPVG